jgi:hypothetical protein
MSRKMARRRGAGITVESEIARYLRTGDSDLLGLAWPGNSVFERVQLQDAALHAALVAAVQQRVPEAATPAALAGLDLPRFTRSKLEPMARGLFPVPEQETVLGMLAQSVTFLTPANIAEVLRGTSGHSTAWNLANLYLLSVDAKPLSEEAPRIVGLSEDTTCFVSMRYFDPCSPLADFVVHEAAHVFHNCKRETIGLPLIRNREWLLEISFAKRETFAYACEAYSRLLVLGDGRSARQALLDAHAAGPLPVSSDVDEGEYLEILQTAIAARNGWKRILAACAADRPR